METEATQQCFATKANSPIMQRLNTNISITAAPRSMRTSVSEKLTRSNQPRPQNDNIRDITARAEKGTDSDGHLAALELSNRTKDAWLIRHSQNLRVPLMSMGSMLGLIELEQKLASVRPLHETPSDFEETAFRHVRKNFQRLVRFFNELSDVTGQSPLQLESSPPFEEKSDAVIPITSGNGQV